MTLLPLPHEFPSKKRQFTVLFFISVDYLANFESVRLEVQVESLWWEGEVVVFEKSLSVVFFLTLRSIDEDRDLELKKHPFLFFILLTGIFFM